MRDDGVGGLALESEMILQSLFGGDVRIEFVFGIPLGPRVGVFQEQSVDAPGVQGFDDDVFVVGNKDLPLPDVFGLGDSEPDLEDTRIEDACAEEPGKGGVEKDLPEEVFTVEEDPMEALTACPGPEPIVGESEAASVQDVVQDLDFDSDKSNAPVFVVYDFADEVDGGEVFSASPPGAGFLPALLKFSEKFPDGSVIRGDPLVEHLPEVGRVGSGVLGNEPSVTQLLNGRTLDPGVRPVGKVPVEGEPTCLVLSERVVKFFVGGGGSKGSVIPGDEKTADDLEVVFGERDFGLDVVDALEHL